MKNVALIVNNIICMIETNYPDTISESFESWCEIEELYSGLTEEECLSPQIYLFVKKVKKIAPYVNALTKKIYEIYFNKNQQLEADTIVKNINDMLRANYPESKEEIENLRETFEGWCEDGDIFYYIENEKLDKEKCIELMKEIAPYVDNLTNKICDMLERESE